MGNCIISRPGIKIKKKTVEAIFSANSRFAQIDLSKNYVIVCIKDSHDWDAYIPFSNDDSASGITWFVVDIMRFFTDPPLEESNRTLTVYYV